jgi:two-component system sensor kinase FixL
LEAWCTALHGEEARERQSQYETNLSAEQGAQRFSLAITRKDGTTRHVEFTICRLDQTHELWMLLDRTEQDQAERALRRSEDYLRSIVNTAVDAIITINQHGIIETFNLAAEQMFGYSAAEVVGQNVRLLMPQPYRQEHDGYIARYLNTGEARIIGIGREVVGLRKDGTTFPLDLAISQIDHLRRFTGILRDLSDRRKLEWRLAESQVEERRYVARELHDGMGGHMTGIGLLAQTLQSHLAKASSPLTVKAEDLVRSIDEAQKQLRSIVRELMPVEATPDGLMAALQELATQAETQYELRCQFQCERPVYLDDPAAAKHVFRIVQEAINNAVRHGKPAHITISLAQIGQRLEVAVSDDGSGLPEMPSGHPGIGLESMCQRAHLLGGDLTVEPREGGGTVVTCWMPMPSTVADTRAVKINGKG